MALEPNPDGIYCFGTKQMSSFFNSHHFQIICSTDPIYETLFDGQRVGIRHTGLGTKRQIMIARFRADYGHFP